METTLQKIKYRFYLKKKKALKLKEEEKIKEFNTKNTEMWSVKSCTLKVVGYKFVFVNPPSPPPPTTYTQLVHLITDHYYPTLLKS